MRGPRGSITAIVSVAIVTVVTTLLLAFGIFVYQRARGQELERVRSSAERIATQLQVGLQLAAWNFDHAQIERLLDAGMSNENVVAIELRLSDRQRSVFAHVRDSMWRSISADTVVVNPDWGHEERLITADDMPLATLDLYTSPRTLAQELAEVRRATIVAVVTLDIVLVLAIWLLLYRLVLKPIKRLEMEAAAVSAGDRTGLVASLDGYLAGEFQRLRGSIAAMVNQLEVGYEEKRTVEEKYGEIVQGVRDVVFSLTPRGDILSLNPAFDRVTGNSSREWTGKTFMGLLHPDDAPRAAHDLMGILSGTESPRGRTYRIRRADGTYLNAEIHLEAQRKHGVVSGVFGVGRDITDRMNLEERLRQGQKMEAIGRLAGGVAHDFNNLLTIIRGRADNLMEELRGQPELLSEAEEIDRAAESAGSMTRQLLAFSRQQVLQPTVVDFAKTVGATERMLRRLVGSNIKLETAIDPATGHVRADVGQLEQVLINLAVNARDAMPEGGTLEIATSNVEFAQQRGEMAPGRYVRLSVRDSGVGMDAETRARVFEPFFTTKDAGRGTGLGLSTVYGVVAQSGGTISVESEPGQGTTFIVHLPIVEHVAAAPTAPIQSAPTTRQARILLVEDIDAVRSLMEDTLRRFKYFVIAVPDAQSAMAVHAASDVPIDLLVTDLMMPDIGGRELAERLRKFTPTLKVLYVSGHSAADSKLEIQDSRSWFLQKPFTPRAFGQKVGECLG